MPASPVSNTASRGSYAAGSSSREDYREQIAVEPRPERGLPSRQQASPVVRAADGGPEGPQPAVAALGPPRHEPLRHWDADPQARPRGAAAGGAQGTPPGRQVERPRGPGDGLDRQRVHPQRQPQADQSRAPAAAPRAERAQGLPRADDPRRVQAG